MLIKMDRLKEINENSELFLMDLLKRRRTKVEQYYMKEQRVWKNRFHNELMSFIDGKEENMKNLVITCLNSSIVTGDNTYQISLYDEDIYVDPFSPCIDYSLEFLFYEIQKDNGVIKEFLHKHFIRLMDYEIEEVRRKYMKKVYLSGKEFFIRLLPDGSKNNISVWFGEYMKNAEYIGRI